MSSQMGDRRATTERVPQTTSAIARAYANAIVKLRFVVIAGWSVAAVFAAIHMPAFGSANGPMVQLIPRDTPALKALATSVRAFGCRPARSSRWSSTTRTDSRQLTQAQIVRHAVAADRHPAGGLKFALPIVNTAGIFPVVAGVGHNRGHVPLPRPVAPTRRPEQARAEAYAQSAAKLPAHVAGVTGTIPGQIEQGR